jgi:antitoxin component of MazEF toxin-antitoxin module
MVRRLQKIGTSRGVILTREMIEHLGVQDAIEINLEEGRIVLTAPPSVVRLIRRKTSAREAAREVIETYRSALRTLAGE